MLGPIIHFPSLKSCVIQVKLPKLFEKLDEEALEAAPTRQVDQFSNLQMQQLHASKLSVERRVAHIEIQHI